MPVRSRMGPPGMGWLVAGAPAALALGEPIAADEVD
jgi:hypothetical protein